MVCSPAAILDRACEQFADRLALITVGRTYTFGELGTRCARLAGFLGRHGVAPGDRVAYLSHNSPWLVEAYFGVPRIGAVLVPLHARLHERELAWILTELQPKLLLYEPSFAAAVQGLRETGCLMGSAVPLTDETFASAPNEVGTVSKELPAGDHPAMIFYTSGSEARPKGAVFSHRALYEHAVALAATYGDPGEVVHLLSVPLFHANGWGHPHACVYAGVPQVVVERQTPQTVCERIEQSRGTHVSLVPTAARRLLEYERLDEYDLHSLRAVEIGGAPVPPALLVALRDRLACDVFTGYGLTEAGPVVAKSRGGRMLRPHPGVSVRLAEDGELLVHSPFLMSGYYNNPQATADVFVNRDGRPWLRTGDIGTLTPQGELTIVDRKKDLIISSGENISPAELEHLLAEIDGVAEVAALGVPDSDRGETPVVFVVPEPGVEVSHERLRTHLERRLSRFKWPSQMILTADPLPRTSTGKISKAALRARFE